MFNYMEMNVPEMTLDLRIAPLVKSVVAKMLLDENDAKEAIEQAVNAAVHNFDWRGQIQEEVTRAVKEQVTSSITSLIHSIFWDDDLKKAFKKYIAKALQE